MKQESREAIYTLFRTLPAVSNRHLLPLFKGHNSPDKRCSEALRELQRERLIENQRLGDMTRAWRPTPTGKEEMGIHRRSISLHSSKLQHYLSIADVYVMLRDTGLLRAFQVEPREPFERLGKTHLYAPDALFVYDRSIYLLEVQNTRLSRNQWAQKWRVANLYFDGHYRAASWQKWRRPGGDYIKPNFLVISTQDTGIVKEGFSVSGRELRIVHNIVDFCK